jgi:hypothetical protein
MVGARRAYRRLDFVELHAVHRNPFVKTLVIIDIVDIEEFLWRLWLRISGLSSALLLNYADL